MSILRGSSWQYIVGLYNAKNTNPLSGWPHRFAAWTVDALVSLDQAIDARQAEDLRKMQDRSRPRR